MNHPHSHFQSHVDRQQGTRRLSWAIGANLLLTAAQLIGGAVAGSLALMADALHNLSDATALIIALVARRIAGRPADSQLTFGYQRAEVVAALVNLTVLLMIAVYLVLQGVIRLFDPQPVVGWLVVVVASVALVVDLGTVLLTHRMSKTSVNIRAAMLHNLADAMTSVGVIVAGLLMMKFDVYLVDVLVTFLVAGYVLYHVSHDLQRVIGILMNSVPSHLDLEEVTRVLSRLNGVDSLHHQHLWSIDERNYSFDAHVRLVAGSSDQMQRVRLAIKECLDEQFGICHSTLEFERKGDVSAGEECASATINVNCTGEASPRE
jgi:cobalt-zinc-cadmium efflux system protein